MTLNLPPPPFFFASSFLFASKDEVTEEKVVERVPVFTTPHLRKLVNHGGEIRSVITAS